MNWWLLVGVPAVLIGAGAWVYASRLPATVTIAREAVVPASTGRVYALVTDVAAQRRWRSDVRAVTVLDGGHAWIEHMKGGDIRFDTIERVPNALFEIAYRSDRGFSGRWRGEFAPDGPNAARVSVVETTTTPSPITRLIGRLVAPPGAHADLYLADLRRALHDEKR